MAKKLNGEVISADSRQVYRGLNIGTGKIAKKEMRGVPHHLLDVANPKKQFSAADFIRLGRAVIVDIMARGKTPIICGGTGFYIAALLGEIELSAVPSNPKLRKKFGGKSAQELFEMLKKIAPARAIIIDPQNPRRLIRAIEIALSKSKEIKVEKNRHTLTLSDSNKLVYPTWELNSQVIKIGMTLPPEKLKEKIRTRLLAQIKTGMVAEAKHLHKNSLSWKRMEELGLEYRYLSRFLRGKISKNEMVEKLVTEIWRYAKRQMTWFKRDKTIRWFNPNDLKNPKQFSLLRRHFW